MIKKRKFLLRCNAGDFARRVRWSAQLFHIVPDGAQHAVVWWGQLVCPSSVQDRRAGQGVRLQLAIARAALDQGVHDNDPRTLHWVAYGEIEMPAGSAALQLLGSHDGTGARWRGLHRVDVEFEVGRAAPARATGLH